MADSQYVPFQLSRDQVELAFSRSSGAGGQNVNKVNSKVEARWNVYFGEPRLPEAVRARVLARYKNRMDSAGYLISVSERTRDRERNIDDAIEKMEDWIKAVWFPPKPRIATRPTRGSERRRLNDKRAASEKKRSRSGRGFDVD